MSAQQQQPITGFHDLPLEKLAEAPFNPRTHFDAAKLADLQASIEAQGVLVPLLVRPLAGGYQILAGARRYRAAKAAKLEEVPCRVMNLADSAALEVAVIDNLQREDVHPLEEAEGFKALLEHGYDVPGIAAKIGKDQTYIYRRLALLKLSRQACEALEAEKITPAHAALLSPLSEERQNEAIAWLSKVETYVPGRGHVKTLPPAATLRAYIESELMLKLQAAPFQILDPDLLPKAGACHVCPKRTSAQAALFDAVPKDDHCLDKACWHRKANAHIAAQLKAAETKGEKLLKIATEYLSDYGEDAKVRKAGVIGNSEYTVAGGPGKKRCPHVERGIVVRGERAGQILEICRKNGCEVHRPSYGGVVRGERTFAEIWKQKRERLDSDIAVKRSREVWRAVVAKTPLLPISSFVADQFRAIAEKVIDSLNHDGQREACAVLSLEGEKRKNYGGCNFEASLLDYYDRLEGEDRFRTVFGWTLISPYKGYTRAMQDWADRYEIDQYAIEERIAEPLLAEFEKKKTKAAAKEKAAKKTAKTAKAKPRKPAAEPDEEDES